MKKTILLSIVLGILLTSFVSAGWFADNFYKADFTGAGVFQAPKLNNIVCNFYQTDSATSFKSQGFNHECQSVNLKSNIKCSTKEGSCGGEFKATEGDQVSWTSPTCNGVASTRVTTGKKNYIANFYNCGSVKTNIAASKVKTCTEGELRLTNYNGASAFGVKKCMGGKMVDAKVV